MKPKKWIGYAMLALFVTAIFVVTGKVFGYLEAAAIWSGCLLLAFFLHTAMYLIFEGED
tara:strand:- start:38 stop:214 length:177 start_codon:yes stop_codon:yes gene_type:complete